MAYKQNLQGAQGGTLPGAHGGTQQLGAAAQRRLGAPGPNQAGGGLNPTPPTMDPAQKPPPWQALRQAGVGGQGSAAANRAAAAGLQPQTKPMPLPGFQPLQPIGDGGLQIMDGAPGIFQPGANPDAVRGMGGENDIMQAMQRFNQGGGGAMPPGMSVEMQGAGLADLPGGPPNFHSGATQGIGNAVDQMQQHGGAPGGGGPLPGFTAAPGVTDAMRGVPLGSMPGPSGKFPPRPGMQTKPMPMPMPMPAPGTPQVRPGIGGGGLGPTGPRPRNNMATY